MDFIRRPGGELVSHRRVAGRRALLPAEAELCNAVGLTEAEYWHFVDLTDSYTGERGEAYDLIPDVNNGPVVPILINLVIGVALSALGALLAPKPKSPQQKEPQQLRTEDINGRSRFTPLTQFDSVQELAALGKIIPLVFAREYSGHGGVRVNLSLLWSQLLSQGTGQQLRAIMMLSLSDLESRPDFAGYAIGDLLLENYTNAKLALYFNQNRRISESTSDRYSETTALSTGTADPFAIYWDGDQGYQPYFSGSRTPSTQTQFGAYSPMPNGMRYKVNYELVLIPDGNKKTKDDQRKKRSKIRSNHPYYAALTSRSGDLVTYTLSDASNSGNDYEPWGSQDIRSAVESARINADEAITLGEQYLAGDAVVACTNVSTSEIWEIGKVKTSTFKIVDGGAIETASVADLYWPYERLTLQRVALATVSNNRQCDVTEIGIKSTVWKQINGFPNVNSQPDDSKLSEYEEDGGSITLGSVNKYITRLSFFKLLVRKQGRNEAWHYVDSGGLFCIRGQSPQPQYNYLRVSHPRGQYEFKMVPYPGNSAYKYHRDSEVWILNPGTRQRIVSGEYLVVFSGYRQRLTEAFCSNPEWILGNPGLVNGEVDALSPNGVGTPPTRIEWTVIETRWSNEGIGFDEEDRRQGVFLRFDDDDYIYTYYWEAGERLVSKRFYGPAPGGPPEVEFDGFRYTAGAVKQTSGGGNPLAWAIQKRERRTIVDGPVSTQTVGATGGTGSGLTVKLTKYSNGAAVWEVANRGTKYTNGDVVSFGGYQASARANSSFADSLNKWDAISDYFLYDAENSSHKDNPEHEIVYVNEQLRNDVIPYYRDLAIAGIRINSSKEWTSFSSLSAYFRRGITVERLTASGKWATNLFPEIAYALLTDSKLGAGKLIGAQSVDRASMADAASYCQANGFFWDGIIDQRVNLRDFIYEQAGYCLLDFTILGGQFGLKPSLPTNTNGTINYNGKPKIKALFTDGNIRDMKVTFLSPEERQMFRATCLYRKETINGFPETRVFTSRLSNARGGGDTDPEEVFDLTQFCTSVEHCKTFARVALMLRKYVDHGVQFETTPQAAMNLTPGDYFYLVSAYTHTDRFSNGSIDDAGTVTSAEPMNGSYQIVYWRPGTEGLSNATLTVTNGKTTQAALWNVVFSVVKSGTYKRCYKAESLTYSEDGLVEVSASQTPLTADGRLLILDFNDNDFVEESG